jgi:hypothetical protein
MSSAVMNPTMIGQPAGNPRLSAIATRDAANSFQNSANKAMAGGKHKRLRGGASTGIPVAQFSLPYKEQSGPGTGINSQTVDLNKTNTQGAAFAVDDNLAKVKTGGFRKRSRRNRIGGNPDWSWGCYSGGKKKTRKHRKSRKNCRKSRKNCRKCRK